MIEDLLATLFLSRDIAHKLHLNSRSFAEHEALGSFYEDIVGLADKLGELYIGRHNKDLDIPLLDDETDEGAVKVLERHLKIIEDSRYEAVQKTDTAIQNHIDEIVSLYLSTLYKLRRFK